MAFTDLEKAQAYADYMTELTGANVVVLKLSDADDIENELYSGPRLSLPDNFDPESN